MVSLLLNSLRYVLWPRILSILVPCEFEENVCSAVAGMHYIQLIDGELNYVLSDFLPVAHVHFDGEW